MEWLNVIFIEKSICLLIIFFNYILLNIICLIYMYLFVIFSWDICYLIVFCKKCNLIKMRGEWV